MNVFKEMIQDTISEEMEQRGLTCRPGVIYKDFRMPEGLIDWYVELTDQEESLRNSLDYEALMAQAAKVDFNVTPIAGSPVVKIVSRNLIYVRLAMYESLLAAVSAMNSRSDLVLPIDRPFTIDSPHDVDHEFMAAVQAVQDRMRDEMEGQHEDDPNERLRNDILAED